MDKFSHLDENGRARMVDVSGKDSTDRLAIATARVFLNEKTYPLVQKYCQYDSNVPSH